ncbi:MAG: holin family protein [Novosphingobium sp.]|nr:holin family protein [Novosphingobium sp.]
MPILEALIGPLVSLIDKVIPDPEARAKAKLELLKLESSRELERIEAQLSAIVTEANSQDPWTSRARPTFLYVMYALILWSLPMGLLSAIHRDTADAIAHGMTAYLGALPEPLYALFGTGYLGYAVMRQWGKFKGTDK